MKSSKGYAFKRAWWRKAFVWRFVLLFSMVSTFANASSGGVQLDCTLSGSVVDENGEPLEASVNAFFMEVADGRLFPATMCSTRSDSTGHFQCPHVRSGRYVIVVTGNRGMIRTSAAREQFKGIEYVDLYPSNVSEDPSSFVQISSGEDANVAIVVDKNYLSKVSILPPDDCVAGRIRLFLLADKLTIPLGENSISASRTAVEMPQGYTYLAEVSWLEQDKEQEASASFKVSPFMMRDVNLSEETSVQLSGSVHFAGGSQYDVPEVYLISADPTHTDSGRYVAEVMREGLFDFHEIPAGDYLLSFKLGDGVAIGSIADGEKLLPSQRFHVDHDMREIAIAAQISSTEISGTLDLEGLEKQAAVLVEALDTGTQLTIRPNARGQFAIRGLAPGRYRLSAWTDISIVPYRNEYIERRYGNHLFEIELRPDSIVRDIHLESISAQL